MQDCAVSCCGFQANSDNKENQPESSSWLDTLLQSLFIFDYTPKDTKGELLLHFINDSYNS